MGQGEPIAFSESQGFRQWHQRIVLAFPPAALLFMTVRQIVFHKPWGSPPRSDGGLIFLTILLTAVYIRLITVKLVTELRRDELVVGLRGLWKRRHISLGQVKSAEVATYDPIRDFGGYGIRSGSRGKAYIAHGNGAAALTLRDGQKIFIGSQNPAALVERIAAARQRVRA